MASGEDSYHPKDAIKAGAQGGLVTGGAGLFYAAIQNALQKHNVGTLGVFTRGGGQILTFAATGAVFEFTKQASANLRERDDHYNTTIGGFLGGAVIGLRSARMPRIIGIGAFTSIVLTAFEYTGGKFSGYDRNPEVDEFDRKEYLRKNRRRPIEQTVEELGEGRGGAIHPPGYEERRRQRLQEKYGVEINPVSAKAE